MRAVDKYSITIIGNGNLGEALSLFCQKRNQSHQVIANNDEWTYVTSPYLFLTVKPQDLSTVSQKIEEYVHHDSVVISFLAATPLQKIREHIKIHAVGRAMTNLAIRYNQSSVSLIGNPIINDDNIINLFLSNHITRYYERDEQLFERDTINIGCAPALWAYLLKSITSKHSLHNRHLINSLRETAELLDTYTPEQLIAKVTSKGGVTEAMLASLSEQQVDNNLKQAYYQAMHKIINLHNE
jgi:pyrroline-5-carboxylate reductase